MASKAPAILFLLLVTPFIAGAPTEERHPEDDFLELYNSTVTEENIEPNKEEPQPKNVSKAAIPPPPGPPQILIPVMPPNIPLMFPRPFSIPFPFPFPPPPPSPQFPMEVVQVITVPRPQKNLQADELEGTDMEEDEVEELTVSVETEDTMTEARRAPFDRRKKKQKKQKKEKNQKKQKKQKQKKNKKKQQQLAYPQPIIIYQNQEEPVVTDVNQQPGTPGATGSQGAQSSYLGYYMVYVVEVRWTGNNYTQTVVTGRPIPAAITVPPTTDPNAVNNLSETFVPANLVNGNRPQPTPTCLFQRSTTTEIFKPFENTDVPNGEDGENQDQVGEESEDSDEMDSFEEEYENDSDPKRGRKKKRKGIPLETSSTVTPKQE